MENSKKQQIISEISKNHYYDVPDKRYVRLIHDWLISLGYTTVFSDIVSGNDFNYVFINDSLEFHFACEIKQPKESIEELHKLGLPKININKGTVMNYLPFNVEIALANPKRVVTRDGRSIDKIVKFEGVYHKFENIVALVDTRLLQYHEDGRFLKTENHDNDLFILPEIKETWYNVYVGKDGYPYVGFRKSTKEQCTLEIDGNHYVKTICITTDKSES